MKKTNNLRALEARKSELQSEISQIESLFQFRNPKKSLGTFTDGFTDRFLEERVGKDGNSKIHIKTLSLLENFAEIGLKKCIVSSIICFTKENLEKKDWKKKILGLLMIYLLPVLLEEINSRLEDYITKHEKI